MKELLKCTLILAVALVLAGSGCESGPGRKPESVDGKVYGVSKGAFRGRWWNYYERGVSYQEGRFWREAEADLRDALQQRSQDQRRARTYGMHFIDYFPHRELGVALYHQGKYEEAIREFEASLKDEKTAKAEFYLDCARKSVIRQHQTDLRPPEIEIWSPLPDLLTNAFSVKVSGEIRDDSYVKEITVNGRPIRIDLAAPSVPFELEVPLVPGENVIRIESVDLSDKQAVAERRVRADWQGPILSIDEPVEGRAPGGDRGIRLRGYAFSEYWDIDFSKRTKGSQAELSEELLRLMRQGVVSRMVADVPLGAFLSGGVDSSSVVALMAEHSRQPVKTCSIGFDVGALDESEYAELIARRFATDHRSRTVAADDFSLMDKLAYHFDEPFADASALPTFRVCELAREQVTVALSGDGADEALAGYRRHVFHHKEEQLRGLLPQSLRGPLLGGLGNLYPKADWAPRSLRAKTTLLSLARTGPQGYTDAVSLTNPVQRHALYSQRMQASIGGYRAEDHMERLMTNAPAQSGLDQAQYADMKMWLPGDILTKVDRTSMAVGLEAREPLLDHRLLEFAASLPENMRIRGVQGKWLMKKTMETYLPKDILYRPKMGFVTPIDQWFRGALADEARALPTSLIFSQMDLFDSRAIAKAAEDHIAGRVNNGRLLWQLVMLEKSLSKLFA